LRCKKGKKRKYELLVFIFRRTVCAPLKAYSSSTHKKEKIPFEKVLFFLSILFFSYKNGKIFEKNSDIRFFFIFHRRRIKKNVSFGEKKENFYFTKRDIFLKNFLLFQKEVIRERRK
jgi:hypothetical protein